MKKTLLTFGSILFFASFLFSQTEKGTIYLGGTFNLKFQSEKDTYAGVSTDGPKVTTFGIDPQAGFFLADKIMIGLGVGYDVTVTKQILNPGINATDSKNTVSLLQFGPFVRYYMMPWEKTGLFIQGNVGIGTGKNKDEETNGGVTTSTESKTFVIAFGITPGVVIFISKMVAIEAGFGSLGFRTQSEKSGSGNTESKIVNNDLRLEFNPLMSFGVAFHIK